MTLTRRIGFSGALIPAAGLALLLATAAPANATAILTVSQGGTILATTSGNGTGPLMLSAGNGSWTVSATGYTKPFVGSASEPFLDLNASGAFVGDLTITFSDSGFQGTGSQYFLTSAGGTLCDSVPYCSGSGASLSITSSTTLGSLSTLGPYGNGAFSGSAVGIQNLGGSGNFGLSLVADITNGAASQWSFDSYVEEVPEPGTFGLFAAGIVALGFMARRRQRIERSAAAA